MKKKKHKKKKILGKPKLPPNENFWLIMSCDPKQVKLFVETGNERQRKEVKAIIDYRLWQIQEGAIEKDFFGDLDVKKLDFNVKVVKKYVRKRQKAEDISYMTQGQEIEVEPQKVIKKTKKPIDLFDIANIEDLTKE